MQSETALRLSSVLLTIQEIANQIDAETIDILGHGDHLELIHHFAVLREANGQIKHAREALEALEDKLSHEEIPDAFRRVGIKTVTVDGVGRVTVAQKWACSIVDGKKPESFQWLRDGGNGGIIIETIPHQTLTAFAKNVVETTGTTLPDDLFTTSLRPYTSITKV